MLLKLNMYTESYKKKGGGSSTQQSPVVFSNNFIQLGKKITSTQNATKNPWMASIANVALYLISLGSFKLISWLKKSPKNK